MRGQLCFVVILFEVASSKNSETKRRHHAEPEKKKGFEQLGFTFECFTDKTALHHQEDDEVFDFATMVLREMNLRKSRGRIFSKDDHNMLRLRDGTDVLLDVGGGVYRGFTLSKEVGPAKVSTKTFMFRGIYPCCAETMAWEGRYLRYTQCVNPSPMPLDSKSAQRAANDVIGTLARWA